MYHSHSTVSIISRHKLTYNTMHNNFNTRISKFVLLYTAVHFIELNLGSAFLGGIFWGILDYIKSNSSRNCFLVCSLVEANLFHKLTLDQYIGLFLFPFFPSKTKRCQHKWSKLISLWVLSVHYNNPIQSSPIPLSQLQLSY